MSRQWHAHVSAVSRTLIASLYLALPSSSFAEPNILKLPNHQPLPCVAFNGTDHNQPWGELKIGVCPDHYAVYSALRVGRSDSGKRQKRVTCCPLPSDDILTDEHLMTSSECPEDYVVTGPTISPPKHCPECDLVTRCTKINTKRYMLGTKTRAAAWGIGASSWKEERILQKRDIPVAIRFAIGRNSEFSWQALSCIGLPFGALLVSSTAIQCHDFVFRQLQYRGLPGDPPKGSPVVMFPDCTRLSSKFEPNPECIR